MKLRAAGVVVVLSSFVLSLVPLMVGQTTAETASSLPRLVRFGGTVKDLNGNPLTGVVGITFALYSEQSGGAALWLETQSVTADSTGHYAAVLGSTKPDGLPSELFTTEQARWVGVQVSGQAEQPRVLLVSAPYALKAGDAETIGGLPPSAFLLAAPSASSAGVPPLGASATAPNSAPPPTGGAVTGTGTVNFLPLWDTTSDIISSVLFQSGTGNTAKVGINTTTPASTLDVKGGGTIRGQLSVLGTVNLPATGAATAATGKNSQPLNLTASAFSSSTSTAVNQVFQWQAEPAGNDTSTPTGTLNLLFGEGATKPSETGLNIASNGLIKFATGQTFPGTGTGNGTVTSVGSGAGLTGGPITGSGTLSVDPTVVAELGVQNQFTVSQKVSGTVTATSFSGNGAGVTGVNASQLGGLASSAFAQLSTADTFTGSVNMVSDTRVDFNGVNAGSTSPGIRFGRGNTGEGISSDRTGSVNQGGIDLYTNFTPRISVTNSGSVGIGTTAPAFTLDVRGTVSGASSTAGANALSGNNSATTGASYGVEGASSSPVGAGVAGQSSASDGGDGVYGQKGTVSATGAAFAQAAGVWGDGGSGTFANLGYAVVGSTDDAYAAWFGNNSPSSYTTLTAQAENSATFPFQAYNSANSFAGCNIDNNGNLNCTGSKNAVVPIDGGARKVALSAIESPQNWFEDFGSARLAGGSAVVAIDPEFAQTVNTETDYMVIPVPNGDCKGLYVTNKTPASFEIRELGGGTSNIRFDYRIVVLRRNYENVRFADHTNDPDPRKQMGHAHAAGTTQPQSHTPTKKLSPTPALIKMSAVK